MEKRKITKYLRTIITDKPIDKHDQERVIDEIFVSFLGCLVESKVLKYTTKIDSEGIITIDFEINACKLE